MVVVAPERGAAQLYIVKDLSGINGLLEGVASLSKAHVEHFLRRSGAGVHRLCVMKIPAVPLMELLDEEQLVPLDLLVIDVKGFDDEVVRMLDLDRVRPKAIFYEHNNLSLARDRACLEHLYAHGYRLARAPIDTLAIDERALEWKR